MAESSDAIDCDVPRRAGQVRRGGALRSEVRKTPTSVRFEALVRPPTLAVRASVVSKLASGKRGDVCDCAKPAGLRLDGLGPKETDQSDLELPSKVFTLE